MAVVGSGVIPRKATLEVPVLPANRRSRRQPPGRTRDSIPLSENHTPIPSPDSGAGPLCERRRREPRSCGSLHRRRTRSLRRSDRRLLRYAGLARDTRPALAIAAGQCSRPGGRLRATPSVANQESHALSKQQRDDPRELRPVRLAHCPGDPGRPTGRGEIAECVAKRKPASTVSGSRAIVSCRPALADRQARS